MAGSSTYSDIINDDRPIALRKTRRSSVGPPQSRSVHQPTIPRNDVPTPPTTPRRTKKRVRFSDPGPAHDVDSGSSGLTPFIRRTSITSTPRTNRRHSTPAKLSNRAEYDTTPIFGTIQFAPLRQVLDGRIKRRLRRHRLSEEVNLIEFDKRQEARERKSEVTRLREELHAKDLEVQSMRDEHDIASQLGLDTGNSFDTNETLSTKVHELEQEIHSLKAELHRREADVTEEVDWDMAARDPYDTNFDDDDDNMVTNYDEDFTMNDDIMTTPARLNTSFPSPPSTLPNTPCRPTSSMSTGIQTSLPAIDPEKEDLRSQLLTLQSEITKLNAAIAFNTDHQDRLTSKLTPFTTHPSFTTSSPISEDDETTTLDTALDRLLTALALAQSSSLEHSNTFSALTTEISNLGFSTDSPDATLSLIASQFRQARLDLEYLYPGETSIGFENSKLLSLLVNRVRILTAKVKESDEKIDQYHEQELLLRQQVGSRVEAMDELKDQLALATSVVSSLREEISEKDVGNQRLSDALDGYRIEVKGLEDLIERIEREALLKEESLHSELSDLESRFDTQVKRNELLAVDTEGQAAILQELQTRLSNALDMAADMQTHLDNITSAHTATVAEKDVQIAELAVQIVDVKSAASEREKTHGSALALRDARVTELRAEIERINNALKDAHATIITMRSENHGLNFELQSEREKGRNACQAVLSIMGYANPEGRTSAAGPQADSSSPVKGGLMTPGSSSVVRRGAMFDAGLARRASKGRKRRRYDSGLGFLSEGEEGEELGVGVGEFSSDL